MKSSSTVFRSHSNSFRSLYLIWRSHHHCEIILYVWPDVCTGCFLVHIFHTFVSKTNNPPCCFSGKCMVLLSCPNNVTSSQELSVLASRGSLFRTVWTSAFGRCDNSINRCRLVIKLLSSWVGDTRGNLLPQHLKWGGWWMVCHEHALSTTCLVTCSLTDSFHFSGKLVAMFSAALWPVVRQVITGCSGWCKPSMLHL